MDEKTTGLHVFMLAVLAFLGMTVVSRTQGSCWAQPRNSLVRLNAHNPGGGRHNLAPRVGQKGTDSRRLLAPIACDNATLSTISPSVVIVIPKVVYELCISGSYLEVAAVRLGTRTSHNRGSGRDTIGPLSFRLGGSGARH